VQLAKTRETNPRQLTCANQQQPTAAVPYNTEQVVFARCVWKIHR